jgi:trk system potassium uptake protein TrkH
MALPDRAPQGPLIAFTDRLLLHPVRAVPLAFLVIATLGTLGLMLPAATNSGVPTPWLDALFTAVSALCVTGLVTLDTGTHWSGLGQAIILFLIQIGGLGLMLIATLLASLIWSRLSLAQMRRTGAENVGISAAAQIKPAARLIVVIALTVELLIALVLTWRFWNNYGLEPAAALWSGVFHAVSAYNNAGFGLNLDSAVQWAADPVMLAALGMAIFIGGLGLPLIWDMRKNSIAQRSRWSLHSKITVTGIILLLVIGFAATALFEWHGALAGQPITQKLMASAFYSVSMRTAGFNNFAMDDLSNGTLVVSSALMFIGAGSASTGGGIKVATAMILVLVVAASARQRSGGRPQSS